MKTVNQVSKLTGVTVRTLHYYDSIGLLHPTTITESGYRLYDDTALERLQHILLFRELQFPLKEIKQILQNPVFDRNKALEQQIRLLTMKKEHLENLITLARGIQITGVRNLDFSAFDTKKIDEYAAQAKAQWGATSAYKEFEEKNKHRTQEDAARISKGLMDIFAEFGLLLKKQPDTPSVQAQVAKLQAYMTEHFYTCTPEILQSLGAMYAGGGSMTENIDQYAGEGTAQFTANAITVYCSAKD